MLNVLVIAAFAALAGAQSAPDQWVCDGSAKDVHGSDVDVTIQLQTDGTVLGRSVSWTPPKIGERQSIAGLSGPDLSIIYEPIGTKLGQPIQVLGSAVSTAGYPLLDNSKIVLVLDGNIFSTASLEPIGTKPDPNPSFVFRSGWLANRTSRDASTNLALLDGLDVAHAGVTTLTGGDGKILAWARYNLSDNEGRDRLFRIALKKAERATAHPERCQKATGSPEDLGITIPVP